MNKDLRLVQSKFKWRFLPIEEAIDALNGWKQETIDLIAINGKLLSTML